MAEQVKRKRLSFKNIEDLDTPEERPVEAKASGENEDEPTEEEFYQQTYACIDESDEALKRITLSENVVDAVYHSTVAHSKLCKALMNQQFIAMKNQEAMLETLEHILAELRKDRRR